MYFVPNIRRVPIGASPPRRLRRQAGATLIEEALVAIVIAGLIAGSLMVWNMVQMSSHDNDNSRDTGLLLSKVRSVFDGQSSYGSGALNSILLTYRAVPASMINGSNIDNPWGGVITVTGAGATFTLSSAGIPRESCAVMVKSFGGNAGNDSGVTAISVNGAAVTSPVTPGSAAAACNKASNTVLLTAS